MKNKVKYIICFIIIMHGGLFADEAYLAKDLAAKEYYAEDDFIIRGKVVGSYFFSKVENDHSSYFSHIVMVEVVKVLKGGGVKKGGGVNPSFRFCCLFRSQVKKLELAPEFYLGFVGKMENVILVEPVNYCPLNMIEKRRR